jgi:hypothetical protein
MGKLSVHVKVAMRQITIQICFPNIFCTNLILQKKLCVLSVGVKDSFSAISAIAIVRKLKKRIVVIV